MNGAFDPTIRTAIAHPNIALIKYWGKFDETLAIPRSDSLSMTLDVYPTTTSVRLAPGAVRDTVLFNGSPAEEAERSRIVAFLDHIRSITGRSEPVAVETANTVPTGAGLASSASGFAALAVAAGSVFDLELDPIALSRVARRGSGSASRSLFSGFAVWHAGPRTGPDADQGCFAEQLDCTAIDPALVIAVVNAGPKKVSSSAAMRRTVRTSPLYPAWVESSADDMREMKRAIATGDLAAVGEIAERNALGMHATMLAARPAVRYLTATSLDVIDAVEQLRRSGILAYVTIDAGPNIKIICERGDAASIAGRISALHESIRVVCAFPGPGARLVESGAA
ncbi:diphosphomevalonate decarboxylase [Nocardia sp. NPDC005825]|uniref:diphosphomevalonate decarboxylase n=1 Tax=unclassified Nocardia TaxID=2637762 RepID=UPI0033FD3119